MTTDSPLLASDRSTPRPRQPRGRLVLALLSVVAMLAVAAPASGAADDGVRGRSGWLRAAFSEAVDRPVPNAPVVVGLRCDARSTDDGSAVACQWRPEAPVQVRSWQVWNLQVRPESGVRTLVAEVGSDVTEILDREVVAPARYLYAVLGLDGAGEIVARSRAQIVDVELPEIDPVPMDLACDAVRTDGGAVVGCEWRAIPDAAGAAGYVLYRQVDGGDREVIARVGLDVTAWRDADVVAGVRYGYVVAAVDGNGEIVGRSRISTAGFPAVDGPVIDARPTDARPVERVPAERPTRGGSD